VKTGVGTFILTGTNTYTGGTEVLAGTLQIGNGGTSGSIIGDILNNANVTLNRSDAVTYGDVMSGTGSLTKTGAGTLLRAC
jgi:autotransporter-associated beta strand protein